MDIAMWKSFIIIITISIIIIVIVIVIIIQIRKESGKEFLRPEIKCDAAWILPKGERDSWIYDQARSVICLLKYAWPVNYFLSFRESLKVSLKPRIKEDRLEVCSFEVEMSEMVF